jgi:hypothetical protein
MTAELGHTDTFWSNNKRLLKAIRRHLHQDRNFAKAPAYCGIEIKNSIIKRQNSQVRTSLRSLMRHRLVFQSTMLFIARAWRSQAVQGPSCGLRLPPCGSSKPSDHLAVGLKALGDDV